MFGRTGKTVLFIMQANVWELLVKPCKLFFFHWNSHENPHQEKHHSFVDVGHS